MTDEETERDADARAKELVFAAWATEPRPGHRERVLDALDAADAARVKAAGGARAVVPMRPRRVWQAIAMMVVALAAVAVAALYYRAHAHPVTAPDVDPQGHFATPVPPHRGQ